MRWHARDIGQSSRNSPARRRPHNHRKRSRSDPRWLPFAASVRIANGVQCTRERLVPCGPLPPFSLDRLGMSRDGRDFHRVKQSARRTSRVRIMHRSNARPDSVRRFRRRTRLRFGGAIAQRSGLGRPTAPRSSRAVPPPCCARSKPSALLEDTPICTNLAAATAVSCQAAGSVGCQRHRSRTVRLGCGNPLGIWRVDPGRF